MLELRAVTIAEMLAKTRITQEIKQCNDMLKYFSGAETTAAMEEGYCTSVIQIQTKLFVLYSRDQFYFALFGK